MDHKKIPTSAVALLLTIGGLHAQQTIAITGGDVSGAAGEVSYSVGQFVYTIDTMPDNSFSQTKGVQQPFEYSQGALPIALTAFTATVSKPKQQVVLHWQTASEINNDYFTIENSSDIKAWNPVERIKASGNASRISTYTAVDKKPYLGLSYYRLKQSDFNGNYTYSSVKTVNISAIAALQIFPVPAENYITVIGSEAELSTIHIYNTLGQHVNALTRLKKNDKTKLIIDLTQLNAGIYYLKTKNTSNTLSKK